MYALSIFLGFSGILHSCLHSNNLALQSHATRALYNLDTDSHIDDLQDNIEPTKHDVYDDGVYLLHPLFKSRLIGMLREFFIARLHTLILMYVYLLQAQINWLSAINNF